MAEASEAGRLSRLKSKFSRPTPTKSRKPKGGWRAVAHKEFADHVNSVRFRIIVGLVALGALAAVYAAASDIRNAAQAASGATGVFLLLFTIDPEKLPFSYLAIVGLLVPLLGIAFGFDGINGERSQGTLPRLVAQPIYRDDVINGKFVAGLGVIAIMLGLLTVLVGVTGLWRLGIQPTWVEVGRVSLFWFFSIVYAGFWLALSLLFSVWLRRAATSALAAIASWLVLTVFFSFVVTLLVDTVIAPLPDQPTADEQIRNDSARTAVSRISPQTLYAESSLVLLRPELRSTSAISELQFFQLQRAIPNELRLDESLLVVWPQAVGLIAATSVCFALGYMVFLRQEVRA